MEGSALEDEAGGRNLRLLRLPVLHLEPLGVLLQTVRPWHEGDKAWVSWTQTFNINVTKELLKKINCHKITLKVWDTKDKVSRKVRYYRLKNTGYSEDTGSCGKSGICVLFETFLEACDFSPVTGSKPVSPPLLHLTFPGHMWLRVSVVCHPSRTGLSIRKYCPLELCLGVGGVCVHMHWSPPLPPSHFWTSCPQAAPTCAFPTGLSPG